MEHRVKLGQKVKDDISGFQGIAVCRMDWLHGCERILVQPPINDKGELPKPETFDEPQIVIIDDGVKPEEPPEPRHGDRDFEPSAH